MAKQERTRARGVLLIAVLLLVSVIGGMLVAGAAGAQTTGDPYAPITSIHPSTTSVPPPVDLRRCIGCDPVLPVTGADLTLFVVTAFAAIATGTVLVRRTRARRRAPEA